jgi:dCTP deaminase
MSVLTNQELKKAMELPLKDRLVVTPLLDDQQIGPASIDLRLGTEFLLLKKTESAGLDVESIPVETMLHDRVSVPWGEGFWLHPSQFVLGSTLEFIRLPSNLAGLLLGRSSWARLGLVVETAGMVQPGFSGALTYELVNTGDSPIRLYPGLRVAQLTVLRLDAPTSSPYAGGKKAKSKYVTAIGPEASRAWEDAELEKVLKVGAKLGRIPKTTS